MAKVTIAIPTYNRQEFLSQSIKSVLGQTFQDFKIIIFDDGSSFSYPEFLNQFHDARVEVRTKGKDDRGNLNNFRGIYNTKFDTEYLVIFHDDDFMHPGLLEQEMKVMENNQNLAWVGTDLNFVKDGSKIAEFNPIRATDSAVKIMDKPETVREILRGFRLCFDSVMYRTKYLVDASPMQARFDKWFDRPYLVSLIGNNQAAIIKQKLVNYRLHTGQDSTSKHPTMDYKDYSKRLFGFYLDSLPKPLKPKDAKLFNTFASNNFLSLALSESESWNEFTENIADLKKEGLFNICYLNFRGCYYFIKLLLKKLYAGK